MATALDKTIVTPGQIIARHQKEAPVDVVKIAEDLGVHVWEMEYMSPDVSGKLFRDMLNGGSSGFSIIVRKSDSAARKRFTIAHEIAHFVLHKDKLDGGIVDDAMYRSGLGSREETEANRLAADILMPYSLIQKLVRDGYKSAAELAAKLGVSKTAIGIRLGLSNVD